MNRLQKALLKLLFLCLLQSGEPKSYHGTPPSGSTYFPLVAQNVIYCRQEVSLICDTLNFLYYCNLHLPCEIPSISNFVYTS